MPSYKIIPTETERIDTQTILTGIEAISGPDSTKDPRRGPIPDTFTESDDGVCWVKFGREETYDRPIWDGTAETSRVNKYPIVFLQNGYVAHGKSSQSVEEEIRVAIQQIIDSTISLDPVEFDETDLPKVIDQASELRQVDITPSSRSDPEQLSANDRGDLRDTTFWEDYDVDPFEKIKIAVPRSDVDVDVGFDNQGTIILYGRNMRMEVQARTLRYLTREIVDRYVSRDQHQGTIGRFKQ